MRKRICKPLYAVLFVLMGLFLSACQEEFSKIIPEKEEEEVDVIYGTPKVLLLLVDGARGESVRTAQIPTMMGMLPNAIHSWVSLSEENALDVASNWTDVLTGVNYVKHGVRSDDFSTNKLASFPVVYKRVMDYADSIKMNVISTKQTFIDHYATGITSQLASNDEDVKSKVIAALGQSDLSFITGHFSDIDKAGEASGYDNSYPTYKASIEKFDGQLAEIMTALKARPNYARENWLVIVTSSQGGPFEIPEAQNDNTIFSNPEVNTFTIMHSPKFVTKFIGKPYIGNKFIGSFMRFNAENYAQLDEGDNPLFDLDTTDFTIELKIKKNKGSNNNYSFSYPSIIGKRKHWQGAWDRETDGIGWVIHLAGESWIFNARGDKGTGEIKADKNMNRGTWNSIAVTGSIVDGKRMVKLYTNGELSKEGEITGWGKISSDAKFRIGFIPTRENWRSDAYLADIKFWKADLGKDVIKQYSCEIGVDPNHPYMQYLVAHYPMMRSEAGIIKDEGSFGLHLKTGNSNYQILNFNDYLCAPSSQNLGAQVPRTIDIATQIISWLKVPRQSGWQLDGRVWIDK
ncbi:MULTISPECIES: LamG-like jellyroll fold domain-containing protein [Sphingobacterium]|uniref:LamG-like jellyroll fold domain-containing protein n=1 Tax=Sphingobacterium tenebrionis TaxID=3111775 RepID=A0ABU8I665_9SPHI|nr:MULTISPECIES: LamG-like jellyroll fold domain-containing protein [unclassified Sphingobacterium]QBR11895.1 DUF4983 domain-containing protein [Sphingobacterium sp. CZ-2]